MRPDASGTVRACHVPTPNVSNAAASSAVKTGAMNIGFHSSVRHVPHNTWLRALCTQAPSSCHTTPTVWLEAGSAVSHRPRSVAARSSTAITAISHRPRLVIAASIFRREAFRVHAHTGT